MRTLLFTLCALAFFVACASQPKPQHSSVGDETVKVLTPEYYSYKIKATYPHSVGSYTQGLQYYDGKLFEGTGVEGESRLMQVELTSGKTEDLASLPKNQFGEGIAVLGDKIYQLTWYSNLIYVYTLDGKLLRKVRRAGEAWGLTTDGESLYLSDGTSRIYKLNAETLRQESYIEVTNSGSPVYNLNEMEWIEGKIWANVYLTDEVVIINPESGAVEAVVDFGGLLPASDYSDDTDVLNGIAYDADQRRIFVTGKRWPKLFEVELIK